MTYKKVSDAQNSAAYVFVRNNDKVLLFRRHGTDYMNGFFAMPSGKWDDGETLRQTAIRELKEEVGLVAKNMNFKCLMQRDSSDAGMWVDVIFECTEWEGEPANPEPHKHDQVGWYDLNDLPKVMPYQLEMLNAVIDGTNYIETESD